MRRGFWARGFTLVELLVVIGIIAVLAGLLLPMLSRSKAEARKLECISRLKQWALAFHGYVDENDGRIPREGFHPNGTVVRNTWADVEGAKLGATTLGGEVWYNAVARHASVKEAADYVQLWDRMKFYRRESFFHCPAAKFESEARQKHFALFSIAMNSQFIEPGHQPTVPLDIVERRPSDTVLFLDNLLDGEERIVDEQAWGSLGQPASSANRFAGLRHRGGGNLAFVDGHVSWKPAREVVQTVGPSRGGTIRPQTNIVWDVHGF